MFDRDNIFKEFPILSSRYKGKRLVYLDSTATTLKPRFVLNKVQEYYTSYSANVFRGIYPISERATEEYEGARQKVATFINAHSAEEVIFTRNTSESINLVAYAWAQDALGPGDSIVTTIMEHHSNFVPWQQIAQKKGATMSVWNVNKQGLLKLNDLDKLITRRTKLLSITALSNVLGTINPVKEIVKHTKKLNSRCMVLVDAAQWVPQIATDVQDWGADFVAFSGHKMLGPTGIGVLWGRRDLLEEMSPFLYGGEMIREVYVDTSVFKEAPHKYEAGTPHIAGAIGLGAAVDYLTKLGMDRVRYHEEEITSYALQRLHEIRGITILGPPDPKIRGGVIAFSMKSAHAHDIAQILADDNICVRAGNHCAMPLHEYYGLAVTARASFYIYSTKKDVDALIVGLAKVARMFS